MFELSWPQLVILVLCAVGAITFACVFVAILMVGVSSNKALDVIKRLKPLSFRRLVYSPEEDLKENENPIKSIRERWAYWFSGEDCELDEIRMLKQRVGFYLRIVSSGMIILVFIVTTGTVIAIVF